MRRQGRLEDMVEEVVHESIATQVSSRGIVNIKDLLSVLEDVFYVLNQVEHFVKLDFRPLVLTILFLLIYSQSTEQVVQDARFRVLSVQMTRLLGVGVLLLLLTRFRGLTTIVNGLVELTDLVSQETG